MPLSLLPNLGLGTTMGTTGTAGTVGTSAGLNKPGSKTQQIAKTTQVLTKQINDITAKILAAKQKAAQSAGPEQQQLAKTVTLLQQQLQQIVGAEQEENEETLKQKIAKGYKLAGQKTGEAIAIASKVPFLNKPLGKMGKYTTGQMSKFIGLESKNNLNKTINNNKDSMKNAKNLKEGILPAIGGAASKAIKTAGNVAGMVPVVGGPVKAAADLAGDVTTGILGGENEENAEQLTPIQDKVVNALAKRKYYVNRVSYQFAEEEGGPTVFMTMKPNHYTSRYAEVSPDGLVNGETLKDFLGGRDENEERMLSKKQQRIAKLAGDPNKIDGADFAKLRAMKQEEEENCMRESAKPEPCGAAKKGCKCNKCKDCKANQKKNVNESGDALDFLRAISQKNYAQADKYLGSLVNEKIKKVINKTIQASK